MLYGSTEQNKMNEWMYFDLPFTQESKIVEQNVHTAFSFPNPLSKIRKYIDFRIFKDTVIILEAIRRPFLPNQQQQQCLLQYKSTTTTLVTLYELSSVSKSRNYLKTFDQFRALFPKSFPPILVFLWQIDRFLNKLLRQLSVHFHNP